MIHMLKNYHLKKYGGGEFYKINIINEINKKIPNINFNLYYTTS